MAFQNDNAFNRRNWNLLIEAPVSSGGGQASFTITFEGLQNAEAVNEYYNGGTGGKGTSGGPNYGVSFSTDSLALIDFDAGGTGNFANEPSPSTVLFFTENTAVMNVPSGFTGGFSFYYSTVLFTGVVEVYTGLNKTGTKIATIPLQALGGGGGGDPGGNFNVWAMVGVAFSQTARSIDFGGTALQVGFDNITVGSATAGP